MKSPRPPRMAGRCAAILLIRLVAPALRSAALSLLARRPLRVFGWSTLLSTLCFLFLRLRHSRTTTFLSPRRARAPGSCSLLRGVSCAAHLPSPAAFRGAAGLLLSCTLPARGGRSAERRTRERSRLRSATTVSARHGPSRATGRRLSALHRGGLWTARPRVTYPTVPRTMPRLPAAGARPAVRVPRPPDGGCTALSGRHTPLRLRTSPETPLTSEDGADVASIRVVVNNVFTSSHEVVM